jgi:hypothetical protein
MAKTHPHHSISYIEFNVPSVETARAFYGKVFGWSFVDYGPDYISFSGPTVNGGFTTGTAGSPGVLVVLYSAALEKTRDAIAAAGGSITKDIFDFPGGRRFEFLDPCGNTLAVWSE